MISFLPKSFDISILSKSSFISLHFYSISATSSHANSLSCSLLLILKTEISVGNSVGMRSHHPQKGRAENRKAPTNGLYFFYHILICICCQQITEIMYLGFYKIAWQREQQISLAAVLVSSADI